MTITLSLWDILMGALIVGVIESVRREIKRRRREAE